MRTFPLLRSAAAAALLATVARAQSFDELLPDSTIFYVSVENLDRTRERFEASPLSALWRDAEVQAFLEEPLRQLEEAITKVREKEGVGPKEVYALVRGQVAFAMTGVTDAEGEGKPKPRFVLLADVGGNGDEVRELARRAEARAAEAGEFRRDEEEFRGATIVRYRRGEQATPGDPDCWFLDGSTFGLANDVEDLKRVLARRGAPPEGSLAARESYRHVRGRLGARSDFAAYADARNLMQLLADQGVLEDAAPILDALGLTAIQALGLNLSLGERSLESRLFVAVRGEKRGILRLLAGRNTRARLPAWVPPDAVSASRFSLDLEMLWEELRRILDAVQEGGAAQVDGFREQIKAATNIDIKTDVFGALGDELVFYARAPAEPAAPGAGGPAAPAVNGVATWSLRDRERLERTLQTFAGLMGPGAKQQDYLGHKLFTIVTPFFPIGVGILPDRLVVALGGTEDVKDLINRYGKDVKGLADSEEFLRALEGMPAESVLLQYSDTSHALRQGLLLGLAATLPGAPGAFLDRVPPAETLERYLGGSVEMLVDEEDGFAYVQRMRLKPGAED